MSDAILLQVGNVSVSCTPIPLLALEYEPPRFASCYFCGVFCMILVIYSFGTRKIVYVPSTIFSTKSFKTVEASLRVDALASAGFKISRSKLVDLIRYTLFLLIVDAHFCLTAYLDRGTYSNTACMHL